MTLARLPPMATDPQVPHGWRFKLLAFSLRRLPALRWVLLHRAFLKDSGWAASARANAPVDRHGRPVAWYTYSALHFLEPRLRPDMEVFEFGAGHSTLWWADRVKFVCAVESDPTWTHVLGKRLPGNTDLRYEPLQLDGAYCRSALDRGRRFDLIVIDGFDRNNCARHCLPVLKDDGVIVWDNAERPDARTDGLGFLADRGFRRIEFAGVGPLNGYGWTTAVLYRPQANCLGI